jgi:hypothetical protein
VVSPPARTSATGFVLVPGERAADFGMPANRPNSLTSVLAPLVAGPSLGGGGGGLAWWLLLCVGALLIALLCVDAVGVGPRHDYLRRRQGRTSRLPPWR